MQYLPDLHLLPPWLAVALLYNLSYAYLTLEGCLIANSTKNHRLRMQAMQSCTETAQLTQKLKTQSRRSTGENSVEIEYHNDLAIPLLEFKLIQCNPLKENAAASSELPQHLYEMLPTPRCHKHKNGIKRSPNSLSIVPKYL